MSSHSTRGPEAPRVFVSYDTEAEDCSRFAHALAGRLRDDGIDARAALFETLPDDGWATWREEQVSRADFVLVVCSSNYRQHFDGTSTTGGTEIKNEASLLRARSATEPKFRGRVLSVLRDGVLPSDVPSSLSPFSPPFRMRDEDDYDTLYRVFVGKSKTPLSPLGPLRSLSSAPTPALFPRNPEQPRLPGRPRPRRRTQDHRNPRAELEAILRHPPPSWTAILAESYEIDVNAPDLVAQLATTLHALDGNTAETQRLIEVCEETLEWYEDEAVEHLPLVLDHVRQLLFNWLPRVRLDRSCVRPWELLEHHGTVPIDAIEDLRLATNNVVFTEIHVAREDDVPVTLEVAADGSIVAPRCLPTHEAASAEPLDDDGLALAMARGLTLQFPGKGMHDGTMKDHCRYIRGRLARLRRRGRKRNPLYMAFRTGQISDRALERFKTTFPSLRLVLLTGELDDEEAQILQDLIDIFSDGDPNSNERS